MISVFLAIITLSSHFGCSSKTAEQNSTPIIDKELPLASKIDSGSPISSGVHREPPLEAERKNLRNNWMNLIQIKKGSYKTGKENTGIFKLTAEVKNKLDYSVDSLVIFVSYFKGSDCLQVAPVRIKNIKANGTVTVKVPDNKDVTRFQFQVRKAYSKALEFCFDIDDPNRTGDDPYHCK